MVRVTGIKGTYKTYTINQLLNYNLYSSNIITVLELIPAKLPKVNPRFIFLKAVNGGCADLLDDLVNG